MPATEYLLRQQRDSDYAFIQTLYASTRASEMAGCGWPSDAIEEFLREQCRLQFIYYQEHFPDGEFWLIEQHGKAVGRLYLFWGETTLQLIDIALLPEYRGKGLGTQLIDTLLVRADEAGIAIGLHVEVDNPALHLYQRRDFVVVGENGVYLKMRRPARNSRTSARHERLQPVEEEDV